MRILPRISNNCIGCVCVLLAVGVYVHPKDPHVAPIINTEFSYDGNLTYFGNGTVPTPDPEPVPYDLRHAPYVLILTAGLLGAGDTWLNTLMLADAMKSHGEHVMGSLICMCHFFTA